MASYAQLPNRDIESIQDVKIVRPFALSRIVFAAVSLVVLFLLLWDTPMKSSPQTPGTSTGTGSKALTSECTKAHPGKPLVQYALMLDAGSTGSRIHVYKFNYCQGPSPVLEDEIFKQVKPGLSSYKDDPDKAADSLKELLDAAVEAIPAELQGCTPVALKATAGLRLLGDDKSKAILKAVENMMQTKYPFKIFSQNGVAVMDGSDEGVFAWVTVNYLLGRLGPEKKGTVGVMDLGGGSTQIVFEPNVKVADASRVDMTFSGRQFSLYQHSYLGYGLMEGRKKIKGAIAATPSKESPCLYRGMTQDFEYKDAPVTLKGTSTEFSECRNFVASNLFSKTTCAVQPCSFDGVYQPPVKTTFPDGDGRDLYAFSYFYDQTEPLGLPEKALVKDIKSLAEKVCKNDVSEVKGNALKENPDWCLDLTFIYGLLNIGYEIPEDRTLHLAKKIKGYETGWCLGATIHMLDYISTTTGLCPA